MSYQQGVSPDGSVEKSWADLNRGPEAEILEVKGRRQFIMRRGVFGLNQHISLPVAPETVPVSEIEAPLAPVTEIGTTGRPAQIESDNTQLVEMGEGARALISAMPDSAAPTGDYFGQPAVEVQPPSDMQQHAVEVGQIADQRYNNLPKAA